MFWKIHVGILTLLYHLAAALENFQGNSNTDVKIFTNTEPNLSGQKDIRHRWPGYPGRGEIPYVIDAALASLEDLIIPAMRQYNESTCIKFVPRTYQSDYVDISPGECDAPVGRLGGRQTLVLGSGCEYLGNILHELGHAIGLDDQHKRSDRDNYITINELNIKEGNQHFFTKNDPSEEILSTKYDYKSIMHQGNYYKSKSPGDMKTLEAKSGEKLPELNEKYGITDTDIEEIQNLYECTTSGT